MISYGQILAVYLLSNDIERHHGATFYSEAKSICAEIAADCSLPLDSVAGVVAALSPNNRWERNVADARRLCAAYHSGGIDHASDVKVATFHNNKHKALAILSGSPSLDVLGGLKVRAFYSAIMGKDAIVIDGHAYAIWRGEHIPTTSTPKIPPKLYDAIVSDYVKASEALSVVMGRQLSAVTVQATTWLVWRRMTAGKRNPRKASGKPRKAVGGKS
jgi:hypothetical protein